jgi:hypothetical protein
MTPQQINTFSIIVGLIIMLGVGMILAAGNLP